MGRPRNSSFVTRGGTDESAAVPPEDAPQKSTGVSFVYKEEDSAIDGGSFEGNSATKNGRKNGTGPRRGPSTLFEALKFAISRRRPLESLLGNRTSQLSAPLLGGDEDNHENNHVVRKSEGGDSGSLTFLDLLAIGIGGTIGSGVFVLTGDVQPIAGPSAVLSWILAGLTCLLSAFSYMELSARIPTRGSCYVFCYATLGEFAAVIGGVCLTLEYGISGAGIARSWSGKLSSLVSHQLDIQWGATEELALDPFAAVLQIMVVMLCLCKLDLGKKVINVLTVTKVLLVLFLIAMGAGSAFLSPSDYPNIFKDYDTFFPEGVGGTVKGTSLLFFGFIGFDEVCCMAARAENPSVVMPRAIAGTLIGAALLSAAAQLSLSYLVDFDDGSNLDDDGEGGTNFEDAFDAKGWVVAKYITSVGEVALLPLVVLVSFMPQPELLAAMSEDHLIPSLFHKMDPNGIFRENMYVTGAVLVLITLAIPFEILWDVISLGVLLSFNLTNTSLIMLRCGNGGKMVSSRVVRKWVGALWIYGALGGYLSWHGYCKPMLDGEEITTSLTAVAVASLLITVFSLWRVDVNRQEFDDITTKKDIFMTPFIPYTPGFAILLNFFLMAQFSLTDHYIFGAFILVFVLYYFSYKTFKHLKKRSRPSFRFTIYKED
ncbi:hypothetical protein TrRE_jg11640, partial [Triparma retinervis]